MKHLKKFSTDTERTTYEGSDDYIEPYVSLVSEDSSVHYNRVLLNYLRFTALEDNSTLQLKKWDDDAYEEITPTVDIEYSWDGFNFTEYDYSELEFSEGQTIYLRGDNPNGFSTFNDTDDFTWHYFTTSTGSFECHGNIMSLLYGAYFETSTNALVIPNNGCFAKLFYTTRCNITTAPELPATSLASMCYESMFEGCTNLISAPELPATTLAKGCYGSMFYGCTSLISAPKLPATTLAYLCYNMMFQGCISLASAPALPATILAESCYNRMFCRCTSLTTAPQLPATTLAKGCYQYMFQNCTSLNYVKAMFTTEPSAIYTNNWVDGVASSGTFVKNPAATWNVTGVNGVPSGWTIQTYNPYVEEYFTTVARENGTISFNIWKSMGTDMITSMSYSTDNGETWVTTPNQNNKSEHLVITVNVSEGDKVLWKGNATQLGYYDEDDYGDAVGSFFSSTCEFDAQGNVMSLLYGDNYKNQMTIEETDAFAWLFSDYDEEKTCGVVNAKDLSLPATTLAQHCYYYMFYGCTSLTSAPVLPATTLADGCYNGMFSKCTNLTTAPELPATRLAEGCYSGMFQNCTSLVNAPELPATTLVDFCYSYMFSKCTNLTTAPELPATTLANSCYGGMFQNCTSLTTAPELPATTLAIGCYQNMFQSCTNLTTAPELPATTLANSCYQNMFQNCTSLTAAPELPAITLVGSCYDSMFWNCTLLNYIKAMFKTIPGSSYTTTWVSGVAATGTFIKNSEATWDVTGVNGVPTGWTVQTASE